MIDIEATLQNEGEEDRQMYMRMIDDENLQITIDEGEGNLIQIKVKASELRIALDSVCYNE